MRVALLWAAFTKFNALAITLQRVRVMSSNLMTDGDFEAASSSWTTGDPCPWNSIKPVGWDVGSFGGDYIVTSGTGNCDGMGQVARQGTFFVQLHSKDQFFQQVSGLPVGGALTLSFWATARPTQGDSYLMVMVDDVEIGNTGIIPDCTSRAASCWTQHEFTFTPTSATAKIGFQFCRGNRDMTPGCCASCGGWSASPFIDDVMLMGAGTPSPTPPPTPSPTQGPSTDRYWKFRMARGNAIYEIQFYSGALLVPTGTANGVASANFNAAGTGWGDVNNMFDGNMGHWSGGTEVYWQDYTNDAWVQYVFNAAPPPINRVVITWYGGTYVSDLSVGPCYIDSSSDGASWSTQYTINLGDTCCPQNTWDITFAAAAPTPAPTAPTPPPTPSPTTPPPTPSPTSAPVLQCEYTPRAVAMGSDTVPGDFQGTDDSCISGGGYKPPPTGTYFGHITADQFHGHSQKVGCLEFTLDISAYIVTHYGRHAAWSTTCPITIFVDATRTSDTAVTGTVIDEIGASTPGYYSKVFTSSTYPAGTQFMMCEGKDNSICGMTVDYIKIYSGALAPAPAPGLGGAGVHAIGDPHLQNVHGQKFDLMKSGKHLLINIPKGESAADAMLRVEAVANRLGGCSDMYFQALNITGSWAEEQQAGGYHYSVSQPAVEHPEWIAFYTVELKVVHGHTQRGFEYLNLYVKHLGRAGFAVGGLLGDDDHTDAAAVPASCRKHAVALADGGTSMMGDQDEHPFMMSSAEATYL